jgi:fructosamine-3-kinase
MISSAMNPTLVRQLHSILGIAPTGVELLSSGHGGALYQVRMPNGQRLVAKVADHPGAAFDIEGYMLRTLAERSHLPVPAVTHSSDTLLLMTHIEGNGGFNESAQIHAAELLADLHSITADTFGLERDTLIGGLHQPNPQTNSWLDFFRDHRLLYMGKAAAHSGYLPGTLFARLEKLAGNLDRWLSEPERPSLIHGDVWAGNVLAKSGRIAGFLDPAIYFAHPEIELAFITLFNTFNEPFFERYQSLRPMEPGFFDTRRHLYNLYPLLVHVRLFGGVYASSVDQILRRFGF